MKKFFAFIFTLIMAMQLPACAKAQAETPSPTGNPGGEENIEFFSERDFDTDYSDEDAVEIVLSGNEACFDSEAVEFSGDTLKINDKGTYILRGNFEGMVTVDAEKTDKIRLVLAGVEIENESSAALYVRQADKVFITLAEDSENSFMSGAFTSIDENNIDAVIFSKDDITLNGGGSLSVSSPAGHGIVSKDSLTITGGSYNISAANNGLEGKDEVCIAEGSFAINSGKDAVQADNDEDESKGYVYIQGGSFEIGAEGDAFSASAWMQIDGGSFDILSGGGSINAAERSSGGWGRFMGGGDKPGMGRGGKIGAAPEAGFEPPRKEQPGAMEKPENMQPPEIPENFSPPEFMEPALESESDSADGSSMKGLKAKGGIIINGGSFSVDSADDAFHSDEKLTVNGGVFLISSGDDAFHAEDELVVKGGNVNVVESYEGLEALHLSIIGGNIKISSDDDGLNAAGGMDQSGFGGRDGMFGGRMEYKSEGSIVIAGGDICITAYGDGLDANGSIEITGGSTSVCGPSHGDTAIIDYYTTASISGGSFIGSGAAGLSQSFTDFTQGLVYSRLDSTRNAGDTVEILDSSGKTVLSFKPELDFDMVIVSSPQMSADENYTLSIAME